MKKNKHKLTTKKNFRYIPPPATKKRTEERVKPIEIILKPGKGTKNRGGSKGGFFWHIYYKDKKVGKVFINYDHDKQEAYIQVFVNRANQGKGIGRVAYKKACEESGYSSVFAIVRKSNIASIRAAEAAGFVKIGTESGQLKMVWKKHGI
jgi:hypothetical protein